MSNYLHTLTQVGQERGKALALTDELGEVSYQDLLEQIAIRAVALQRAGVSSGDRVAFVAENSTHYVVNVLAVWQADGVPVTIYPSTTAADLSSTLLDADPVLVLSDQYTNELVCSAVREGLPTARIDEPFQLESVAEGAISTPQAVQGELALICYSSGTTARPKAIMLSAQALLNSAQTFSETWRLTVADVTLVCLPMAWLFGLTTASLSTLFVGGTVVSRRRSKPELLATAIEQQGVTFLPAVTTVLTKFANYLDADARVWDLSSLRFIISGGEPRNEQSFALLKRYTNISVHDNYCASEMQPLVTYDPLVDPEPREGSAGRLVPRSELRLLDADGNDVQPGETGEAISRGPGIMLGYWNDPELTAETLTPEGWYRTKDLLRVDSEGYIYVVGRTSDMIIRGGSNVSPGEIESELRQHADVLDVAVVGLPDALYGEEVVAAVQFRDGAVVDADALREFAAARLSGFKVPTRFVQIDQLPHNSTTHKVNRKAVKAMLLEGAPA
ncbi:long-chain acyl-CoA synthetase [Leucobacter exalbidus]|uniref:Long-chain acyl-CoA synthetase n=1 Tax=Leucobacter exalbidus TaxID=662960 RepID=A0A940PWN0_9MICO|nr:class I adenylate-forming enzyme family protein [Leucobacter exalbidus]MBP1326694.1 long-chain acyl-CoA synthetase [Leucobacter exalbidus]